MNVVGGRGANCRCFIAGSRLAEPIVVIDCGEVYRDASGHADGYFDFPVVDTNAGTVPPRGIGVVRFRIVGGRIVDGSVVSAGAGYVERPRNHHPAALMLGAAYPATSVHLVDCQNPEVTDVRQIYRCGVVEISGGAGARILTGHARDIASHGVQIGPTDDVVVSGWDIKGVHGGVYHTAGIRLTAPVGGGNYEDPVTSRVRITDNIVDDVNAGSCFDAVACGLQDIRFERNTAIQRRPGGFFCMQIKLGRPSRDPKSPGGGVRGVVYRDNRVIQHAPGGMAVDFQNNSKWDDFEVDFDRSNTIEYTEKSDIRREQRGVGANSCGLRVHNLSGGVMAPTILFAPVGVRPTGRVGTVVFSPRILRCRVGRWSVFAAGSGSGLALAVRAQAGRVAAADVLAGGEGYLDNGKGEFLLDVPPGSDDGGGRGAVLAVEVEAGSAVRARVVKAGEAYLDGGSGVYEPMLPEHARLVATVRGGEVVALEVLHCGWRFHQPPILEIDRAAGGSGVSLMIGLAGRSFGAWFADAAGPEISGGFYQEASGDIGFAADARAPRQVASQ
ncbi:MAG: hypothetical protein ACR2F8_14595 [Caulobacteraceae bacterium]